MNLEAKGPFVLNPDVLGSHLISQTSTHTFASEGELKLYFSGIIIRCISENIELVKELMHMNLSPFQDSHLMLEQYKNFLANYGFKLIEDFVKENLIEELQKSTIYASSYSLDYLCNTYFSL